jgi:LPS sulfotransferase NodH
MLARAPRPFPIAYKATSHEKRIIEHFGAPGVRFNRRLARDGARTFVICFTNRSGSNLLAELISTNADFGRAGEYLNADGVLKLAARKKFKTLQRYLQWLHEARASKAGILGIKLAYQQLFFLARTGLMPGAFGDVRFVHIRRRDVLKQAVSLIIATQTKSWTSGQASQLDEASVNCDETRIARVIDRIHEANAKFRCFFDVYGIRPVEVIYEDLTANLEATGGRVIRELGFAGVGEGGVSAAALTLAKQSKELNEKFVSRFLRAYDEYRGAASSVTR